MLTTVSQKLNLTCKKNTVSASNVLDSAITKLQNLRVASNVVASTWALVSNGMVMWVRHRWRSWYGNDSNMWMVLLLNVIATIFGIGLLYKRSNKFLLEDLFETPQQIHVVCTCHENYEPRISPVWFPHAVTLRTNPGWKALAKAAPQHKHTRKSTYSSRANVVFFSTLQRWFFNVGFSSTTWTLVGTNSFWSFWLETYHNLPQQRQANIMPSCGGFDTAMSKCWPPASNLANDERCGDGFAVRARLCVYGCVCARVCCKVRFPSLHLAAPTPHRRCCIWLSLS